MTTQAVAMQKLGQSLVNYREDWAAFSRDYFGVTNDAFQDEILWAVQGYQKTAVAGAQGVGKDFVAAQAAAAKLMLYPYCKVGVTSASKRSLRTNFWGELAGFYKASDVFQKFFEMDTQSVRARGAREEWFLIARTSNAHYSSSNTIGGGAEKEAESIAGMYGRGGTLVIVDEASGVDDAVFDSLEGTANAMDSRLLYIGNPLRRSGRFHDVFRRPTFAEGWRHFHIDFTMSSRTNTPDGRAIRLQWIKQHGKQSAFVQARVWGRFPTSGSIDTILHEDLVASAFARNAQPIWLRHPHEDRWWYPLSIGVDPARFGDDETVIVVRSGPCALRMEVMGKKDSTFILGRVLHYIHLYSGTPQGAAFSDLVKSSVDVRIDEGGGYGSGIIDPLRKMGFRVAGVHNGSTPKGRKGRDKYDNLATQLWDEDLKQVLATARLGMINDDALLHQLTSRQYEYTQGRESKMRLVSKDRMRRAGMGSPDRADALVLAFAELRKLGFTTVANTIRLL